MDHPKLSLGRRSKRGRVFLGAMALGSLVTLRAEAQGDPAPSAPEQAPGDAGAPEPPSESPPPPPAEPPPAPPAKPWPQPEEPIVLPEEPPSAAPAPAPQKPAPKAKKHKPPRASFPEPPPEEPEPAPKPRAKPTKKARPSEPHATAPARETEPAKPSLPPVARSRSQSEQAPKQKEEEEDSSGLFGPFRIGGLLGVGLPSVISFGGAIKLTRYLGGGLNIGLIPTIRISLYGEAELAYQEYDIYGRLFPFGSMFFVGAGAGYATMTGSFRKSYDVRAYQSLAPGLPAELFVESKGSVRTLVLTPQIGLQQTWGSGFTLGIDLGLQIPLAPSEVEFSTRLPEEVPPEVIQKFVEPNDEKVRDTLETVGRAIVPTLNLRIGWLL